MKHFLFERKEYRISPVFRNPRKRPLHMGLHALRGLKRGGGVSGRGSGGGGYASDARQRCVVKMNYSKSLAAHYEQINRYLAREGAGKEGEKADLYGTPEGEYRAHMTGKNIRIFLSPEASGVPLETLTKTFVKKLELETGYKLYWVGANHYNTAHPHAHLLINGRDRNGREVYFPRDVVKTLMRESARDICTSLTGVRTKADMAREKEAALGANRYTFIDGKLKDYMRGNKVDCAAIKKERERYAGRLDHLRTLGLCRWKGGGYEFEEGWEETLKAAGRYNMFLEARKLCGEGRKVELYGSGTGIREGTVRKIYKIDEISDDHAVLLETSGGKAYFIPLYRKPGAREGETVRVVPKKGERGRLSAEFERAGVKKERHSGL
jgi:hypothetical protein